MECKQSKLHFNFKLNFFHYILLDGQCAMRNIVTLFKYQNLQAAEGEGMDPTALYTVTVIIKPLVMLQQGPASVRQDG